ncbi:MAG: FliA/WhiG family RNA polymerase sigma factor [Planctomycetota bacterium]|nr:MAG: FliA/WhiG family RNA polymerase sigma factor [Planctomycetota bacterium]
MPSRDNSDGSRPRRVGVVSRTRFGSDSVLGAVWADDRSNEDPRELWERYQAERSDELRNELVEHYLPIVRYTAERMRATLPQSVELDDLISAGIFGLVEAIKSFDLERNIKFKTYASWRVRGAILDSLRAQDWVPRLVRTQQSKLAKSQAEAEALLGRPANDIELAGLMGISLSELRKLMTSANAVTVVSLQDTCSDSQDASARSDLIEDPRSENPLADLQRRDVMEVITKELNLRERLILILYYFEELTLKEVGLALDISESRACQLHGKIMKRLRSKLASRKDELAVSNG